MRGVDEGQLRDATAHPGADPRQWVSYGIVMDDPSGDVHSVRYNDDDGAPLPHGVLVDVKLQPSGIEVPCRMIMRTAGSGEGEWDPIGPGDEVLVAVPEGDERAGCVILGMLSNARSVFPTLVAGQDTTKNNIVMRRYKSPYILESGYAIQFRNALTGSQLVLDNTGGVIIGSGDKHSLVLTAVGCSFGLGDGSAMFQLNPDDVLLGKTASIQTGGTSMVFSESASTFQSGGTLWLNTSGTFSSGHAVTIEQLMSILANLLNAIAASPLSPTTPPWASTISPPVVDTILSLALAGAIIPSPYITPGAGGGLMAALPLTFAPVSGAIALGLSSPLPSIDITGFFPGIGRPGLLF